ncbi:lymphotactin [Otolemur garnettii]|uniref:lymphotactin n=1 Tax=Otolemur garnettii TaxID=30611 RepID=UPI000273FE3A|nr:lymphotactin [Otolemur garnettii]
MRPFILAFLGICCLTAHLVEGVGSEIPEKSICLSLTTRQIPISRIKKYTIKEGSVQAIILITKRGLKFCADPQAKWVKSAIEIIDGKSKAKSNMLQTQPIGPQQSTRTAATLTG